MIAARIPVAAVAGVFCTLAVFLGLWRLVGVPLDVPAKDEAIEIDFTRQIVDTPVRPPPRTRPEREPRPPTPDAPRVGPGDDERVVRVRPDFIRIGGASGMGLTKGGGGIPMGVDRDVTALIQVHPVYPPREESLGIQGWVRVQFNVTATGAVSDVFVVASEPGGEFDEAALEAVARWRYNPRIVNGTAVERVGLQTLVRFTIENP